MVNEVNKPDVQIAENSVEQVDDSLEYARSLEKLQAKSDSHLESDDPLAVVKELRLQQLAACRIKTANQLQAEMDKTKVDLSLCRLARDKIHYS